MTESHNIVRKYYKNVNLSDKKSQDRAQKSRKCKFRWQKVDA